MISTQQAAEVLMDPDCAAGKHRNCDGTGWDAALDAAPCPCTCLGAESESLSEAQRWVLGGAVLGDDVSWATWATLGFLVKLGLIYDSADRGTEPLWVATEAGQAAYFRRLETANDARP